MVQGLGLGAFTAGARVCSLVGELRSCKPSGGAKIFSKIKKNNKVVKFIETERMVAIRG